MVSLPGFLTFWHLYRHLGRGEQTDACGRQTSGVQAFRLFLDAGCLHQSEMNC